MINNLAATGETYPQKQESTLPCHLRTTSSPAPIEYQQMHIPLASSNTCQVLSMRVRESAIVKIAGVAILAVMTEEAVHIHTCILLRARQ